MKETPIFNTNTREFTWYQCDCVFETPLLEFPMYMLGQAQRFCREHKIENFDENLFFIYCNIFEPDSGYSPTPRIQFPVPNTEKAKKEWDIRKEQAALAANKRLETERKLYEELRKKYA